MQATELPAAQRVGYRDRTAWLEPPILFAVFGLRWLPGGWHMPAGSFVVWLVGVLLLEVSALFQGLRSMRGLTLGADGITWHKHALFIPWSNVEAVDVTRDGGRLVVRAVEPDQVLSEVTRLGRWEAQSNLKRFGGPIALRAHWLSIPAAEVTAQAERLRQEYAAAGGFAAFVNAPIWSGRERATRAVRILTAVGVVGLALALLSGYVSGGGDGSEQGYYYSGGALFFHFRSQSGRTGYMDQVLDISNDGRKAVAPVLTFVPLDGAGRRVPGVTVRTAYGSDHGLVVVPPNSSAYDVLAFRGPGFQNVVNVKATVTSSEEVASPAASVIELHAQRITAQGSPVEPLQAFSRLVIPNPNPEPVQVRMVCIIWTQSPPGSPQQMLASIPIGDLVWVNAFAQTTVDVTGPIKDHTQMCGSVKTYLSRPAPAQPSVSPSSI